MKKRILSCFMALALCLTLLPATALAAADSHDSHCICGLNHKKIGDHETANTNAFNGAVVLWDDNGTLKKGNNPWTAESIPLWSNSDKRTVYVLGGDTTYYLGSDLNFNSNTSIQGTEECAIAITGDVTLCLNGHSITCTDKWSAISVYGDRCGSLTLTDCKSNGKIIGGSVAAVDVRYGKTFNMYGGTLVGSKGNGVYLNGSDSGTTTFNMYGGVIGGAVADSDATGNKNSGVRVDTLCEFNMSGGTISKNKANYSGGGVYVNGGTFTMKDGATITENTAGTNGGGVYVDRNGTFNMEGGTISGNKATGGSNSSGGGVFVNSGSKFNMSGGTISNNTADSYGGGVYAGGTFTVSGTPTITGNNNIRNGSNVINNVHLYNNTITIGTGGLTKNGDTEPRVGVTVDSQSTNAPTDGNPVDITSGATKDLHSYFKADDESKYQIGYNSETNQVQLEAKPKIDLTNSAEITITSQSADLVYTGRPITVAYEVKCNNKTLEQGKDYTVTGGSGTDAKEYTLTIEGAGDYKGTVTQTWKITPLTVNVDLQRVELNSKVYDGTTAGNSDDVSVGFKNLSNQSVTLTKGTDYTIDKVTYLNANAGTQNANIDIRLTENGNYTFAGSNKLTTTVCPQGTITKASADKLTAKTGEINVVNNKADTYTLNLNDLLPTLPPGCEYGEITYKPDSKTFTLGNYHGPGMRISDDGTTLILPIAAANDKAVGETICNGQVTVTTQNYQPITLTINVKVVAAPLKDPEYTPPTAKSGLVYTGKPLALINEGTAKNGTMQYCLSKTGVYSTEIPMATNAGDYNVYYKVVGDSGYSNTAVQSILVHINKAKLTGEPIYTKITAAKKTLADAALERNTSWPTGTIQWVDKEGKKLDDTTEVKADTAYKWIFTPTGADADNYTTAEGTVILYSVSTGSSSSGGSSSSDSNPIIKTETKNNPDGSTTKTETRKDGTVVATTTAKDGSVTKTTTNPNGSSVTEIKAADGSTGTVKTDKNGQTTAETKVSAKAVEDAKKSGEAVKAPVEVEASRDSSTAPTVKIELPKNSGDTKVEIPVSNVKPGTVAVLVHPDGTEEIVKNSLPTEDGIQLTVNGSATVKIVDNAKDFIDTQNHWAKDAIDFVSARGLVNGMSATLYAPDASTTRAQLWTILARQNDANLTGGANWYEKAQLWSKDKGISDGTQPDATTTRAQIVTMLWRAAGSPAAQSGTAFQDVEAGSYYAQAVAWAVESGITAGVGGGRFDPNATCTRGQIATFLYRYMK